MDNEKGSFEELLKEAPKAPAAGTVSLVGTIERSKDDGKFVLTLTNGSTMTLEARMVKSYAVLGESVGRKIIRVDVDREKVVVVEPVPIPWDRAHGVVPFTLAASQQVSPDIFARLQSASPESLIRTIYTDVPITGIGDPTGITDHTGVIEHLTGLPDLPM